MRLLLFTLLTALSACTISFAQKSFHQNKVIAHRGAWKAEGLPQNSIASLKQAVELGCEGSEFDVWMTADGVLVVNHDADFEGMDIETSTYQELTAKKLPNGEQLPTVKAYLKAGKKQKGTKLIFEIKPSRISVERSIEIAEKSVMMVKKMKAEKWVDYITFSYEGGLKAIETDPEANVAYLTGDKTPAELKEAGYFGFDYNINLLRKNPQWIKEAQELGLTVNAWTVNKEEDLKWFLEQNPDFITTDEPELLFKLMESK
ncbi:glycerophosphodiester phosphodiesterase family protein [Algoriphagus halophytocola]|uniref:Glycerophosphodiester phosphodiesterase family protein n=1 Tax=Algoriphagus halophytocola TaxID=2991499 RepID=A0ABY6MML6_9BACT|nr:MULTISPECIES: glycerophosphodiester phosphodiesterase family protein [unclassified Algoriphagus]UZD24239.1 glycerophosphodiester phosphodiesterase family protein [Algoriphagus sp. TR-M5]WBL41608.1 glycerophosphodiester phosphodiesterase family protein [Algoriphagus sp. TR-M9]